MSDIEKDYFTPKKSFREFLEKKYPRIKSYIGIDGLLEIAKRHGLESYTTAIGPGADGLECVAVLHWKDKDTEFRATRNEAILDGMLERYTVGKAIEAELKDELERVKSQAEGKLV